MSVIKMQMMLPALTLESGTHLLSRCLALRLTVNTRMFYSPQQDTLWQKLSECVLPPSSSCIMICLERSGGLCGIDRLSSGFYDFYLFIYFWSV